MRNKSNKPIPDVNINGGLWYLEDVNCFTDEDGQVIYEMHALFEPWELSELLKYCRDNLQSFLPLKDRFGRLVDIFYLIKTDDTDEESYETLMGHISSFPDDRNILYAHHHA